jgi:hypothetical protein
MWYPVRTRVSIRQESQFKYDRPDGRASKKEIADSTSTVWTTAIMVRTRALLIWKLRVEE